LTSILCILCNYELPSTLILNGNVIWLDTCLQHHLQIHTLRRCNLSKVKSKLLRCPIRYHQRRLVGLQIVVRRSVTARLSDRARLSNGYPAGEAAEVAFDDVQRGGESTSGENGIKKTFQISDLLQNLVFTIF